MKLIQREPLRSKVLKSCIGCNGGYDPDGGELSVFQAHNDAPRYYLCDACLQTARMKRDEGRRFARLKTCLKCILINDTSYEMRYHTVFEALAEALFCGLEAGVEHDSVGRPTTYAYINLPDGQVSWILGGYNFALPADRPAEQERLKAFCDE